jgi:hypothetical protein
MMNASVIGLLICLGGSAVAGCSTSAATPDTGMTDVPAMETDQPSPDAAPDSPVVTGDAAATDAWQSLFNGVDLTGWQRYLGKPWNPPLDEPPLGLENDPHHVFTVDSIDGEPALHISGETFGALISEGAFERFHLRLEYRWGTQTWPPLNRLDSGIMVFSTGPLGAVNMGGPTLSNPIGSGAFLVSLEYQMAPGDPANQADLGDIGSLYNLGPISCLLGPKTARKEVDAPGWNRVEIVARAGSIESFLNGDLVTSVSGCQLTLPGQATVALTAGKLQLQSENGEIYFRRVEILPLP